ncbi:hypothetical protein J7U46_22315 [Pelomonas sp. V22]|uniref:hypothetical protein n=1 Tax=Pelomonas sp. V22 TaxID=2822139 RepID=UPI0024A8B93A|nr:hypothetical protein [Pelomonas sp. V22]MDI4635817.1 hypothetical protein [Pelomonas sp. V22]
MFGSLFPKKKAIQVLQQRFDEIEVSGEVQGSGLDELRVELALRLRAHPGVENAYLPRLRYHGEDSFRNCLAIGLTHDLDLDQRESIAASCGGIIPLDILFLDALPDPISLKIESQCRRLFLGKLAFFECPLLVRKGSNAEMPANWPRAVSFWYFAATDYKEALVAAVAAARADGYVFDDVYEGKVAQLDPSKWWEEHVMVRWAEHADFFPSQERVEAVVATGGLFRGPNLGPVGAIDA